MYRAGDSAAAPSPASGDHRDPDIRTLAVMPALAVRAHGAVPDSTTACGYLPFRHARIVSVMATQATDDLHPCACGCGTLVSGQWARGHYARGAGGYKPQDEPPDGGGEEWDEDGDDEEWGDGPVMPPEPDGPEP